MAGSNGSGSFKRGWFSAGLRRRFIRNRKGASAVEFAMIAPLFFGFLFAMFETGTLFIRATALEVGVEEAKRVTMTGQVAGSGAPALQESAFRSAFCAQVGWIISCDDVKFDVRAFDTFGVAAMPNPVSAGVFNPGGLQFNPGKPCQIVVIRAYYQVSALTGFIRNDVANLSGGEILLGSSAAFKNEPFGPC